MQFIDRQDAGKQLAKQLEAYANRPDAIILALPRGGVPVAVEVAKALQLPLDVWIVRKLGTPQHEEMAMGAIASGDIRVMNQQLVHELNISEAAIAQVVNTEKKELERREQLYRHNRPRPELGGKTVLLIDDGLATGATMSAAAISIQQKKPARLVIAVPVASYEACTEIRKMVDEVVCVLTPRPFGAVGNWYQNFPQTSDQEVQTLLQQANQQTTFEL